MSASSQHHSKTLRDTAQAAINVKLEVLRTWATSEIPPRRSPDGMFLSDERGHPLFEYFPTSLRQFKSWDGSRNSPDALQRFPPLRRISNDTLARRPTDSEQAQRLIGLLLDKQRTAARRHSRAAVYELGQELQCHKKLLELRVAEIRDQQRTIRRLETELETASARLDGAVQELRRHVDRIEAELSSERSRNAELVAMIAKVTPMKRASRGNL